MPAPDPAVPVPGACTFAASRLLPLLDTFFLEIGCVRDARDTEAVHRLRVASRRLRAALPLFPLCFAEKDLRIWIREVKACTRALGAARDTDVRIAFLKKYLKYRHRVPAGKLSDNCIPGRACVDPLVRLQKKLRRERKTQQERLVGVLDKIEQGGDLIRLRESCRALADRKIRGKKNCISGIPPVAADRIGARLVSPQRYEPFIRSPDAAPEHHALRIAIKKLRYTIETFAPLYRRGMKRQIAQLKRLQDLLGAIHDCDVWIDDLGHAILTARSRKAFHETTGGNTIPDLTILRHLLTDRERERNRLYRQFVRCWDALLRAGFWENLESFTLDGQRSACRHRKICPQETEEAAFLKMLDTVPDQNTHCLHVAELADRLFTGLFTLHNLKNRDRTLLRYAALVHDIGWAGGGSGHQARGAALILAQSGLAVSIKEQGMIALIAGLHGGQAAVRHKGFYRLLPQEDKKRVLLLSSLLRIADGFDYTRDGCITDIRCTIRETEILCEPTGTGNTGPCRERARKKSDLFATLFTLPLVIP